MGHGPMGQRRVASPVTATTNFLAADILNKCGRALPAPSEKLLFGDEFQSLSSVQLAKTLGLTKPDLGTSGSFFRCVHR